MELAFGPWARLLDEAGRVGSAKDFFASGLQLRTYFGHICANLDYIVMEALHLSQDSLGGLLQAVAQTVELGAEGADFRDELLHKDLADCRDDCLVGHTSNSTLEADAI